MNARALWGGIQHAKFFVVDGREFFLGSQNWDWRALEAVYKQFQEIRLYYEFADVDVDRYQTTQGYRQVMVAAREMELANKISGAIVGMEALTDEEKAVTDVNHDGLAEGLAVLHEGDGETPPAGRNRSAIHEMYARALALERPFPRLDQASNPFLSWPLGDVPYLLGGRFMAFVQARYGQAAVAGFNQRTSWTEAAHAAEPPELGDDPEAQPAVQRAHALVPALHLGDDPVEVAVTAGAEVDGEARLLPDEGRGVHVLALVERHGDVDLVRHAEALLGLEGEDVEITRRAGARLERELRLVARQRRPWSGHDRTPVAWAPI